MLIQKATDGELRVRRSRHGATLIDVATGSMLLTVLLIPSIHMIGKSQSANRRLHHREIMVYEAEQLIETAKIGLSDTAAFANAMARPIDVVSVVAIEDAPDMLSRLRVTADSSLPTAQLLTISADVWIDADRDSRFDANEHGESLRTQWAAP